MPRSTATRQTPTRVSATGEPILLSSFANPQDHVRHDGAGSPPRSSLLRTAPYRDRAEVQRRRRLINSVRHYSKLSSPDSRAGIRGEARRYNSAVHFVYIVRCRDGTLYTGYARDPRQREKVHNSGRGARYTSGRLPVTLAYSEPFDSKSEALRRECELKSWSRAKKEALIRDGVR